MTNDEALQVAEAALQRGEIAAAEHALKTQWPDIAAAPADAKHVLGSVRWKQGRLSEAEALFMQASVGNSGETLRDHIALGHVRMEQGKYGSAQESYGTALHLDPKWPGLQDVYSIALYKQNRFAEAEKSARAAISIQPTAIGWDTLSSALREQGKIAEAVQAAQEALKIRPDDAGAQHSLGAAYLAGGKTNEALEIFDKLADRGVKSPPLFVHRGMALEKVGRTADAARVFAEARNIWPNFEAYRQALTSRK